MTKIISLLYTSFLGLTLAGCVHNNTLYTTETTAPTAPAEQFIKNDGALLSYYIQGVVADVRGDEAYAAKTYNASAQLHTAQAKKIPTMLGMRVLEKYLLTNQPQAAVATARQLAKQGEDALMLFMVLTADAFKRNAPAEAEHYITAAKAHLPQLSQLHVLQAYADIEQGKSFKEAITPMQKTDMEPAFEARWLYHQGRMARKAGDDATALSKWQEAHEQEPGALFSARQLAAAYARINAPEKAIETYTTFQQAHTDAYFLYDVSLTDFMAVENQRFARSSLQHDGAETFFGLSILLWAQGAALPARQFMTLALWLWPEDDFMPYYAGILSESAGKTALATAFYARSAQKAGVRLPVASRQAMIAQQEARYTDAEALLQHAIAIAPKEGLQRQLAQLYYDIPQYEKAVAIYSTLITAKKVRTGEKHAEKLANLLFVRGASYERLNNLVRAEKDLIASLELVPNTPLVMNYLAYMWVDANMKLDKALSMLKAANLLAPTDPAIQDSLGWAYYKKGAYPQALLFIEKAANALPDDATIWHHLGDVYHALKRTKAAKEAWEQALKNQPETIKELRALGRKLSHN